MNNPVATDKEIGERLREARERAGLTQTQAAKLLGLGHQNKLARIELGIRKVAAVELVRFAEVYAVGYEWILGQWADCDLPEELVSMAEKLPPVDRRKLLQTLVSFGSMY